MRGSESEGCLEGKSALLLFSCDLLRATEIQNCRRREREEERERERQRAPESERARERERERESGACQSLEERAVVSLFQVFSFIFLFLNLLFSSIRI